MKPFNLEAAARGEPIMLRNGTPCTFAAFSDSIPEEADRNAPKGRVGGKAYPVEIEE